MQIKSEQFPQICGLKKKPAASRIYAENTCAKHGTDMRKMDAYAKPPHMRLKTAAYSAKQYGRICENGLICDKN